MMQAQQQLPPKKMADKKGTMFAVIEEENTDDGLPAFEDYLWTLMEIMPSLRR